MNKAFLNKDRAEPILPVLVDFRPILVELRDLSVRLGPMNEQLDTLVSLVEQAVAAPPWAHHVAALVSSNPDHLAAFTEGLAMCRRCGPWALTRDGGGYHRRQLPLNDYDVGWAAEVEPVVVDGAHLWRWRARAVPGVQRVGGRALSSHQEALTRTSVLAQAAADNALRSNGWTLASGLWVLP